MLRRAAAESHASVRRHSARCSRRSARRAALAVLTNKPLAVDAADSRRPRSRASLSGRTPCSAATAVSAEAGSGGAAASRRARGATPASRRCWSAIPSIDWRTARARRDARVSGAIRIRFRQRSASRTGTARSRDRRTARAADRCNDLVRCAMALLLGFDAIGRSFHTRIARASAGIAIAQISLFLVHQSYKRSRAENS